MSLSAEHAALEHGGPEHGRLRRPGRFFAVCVQCAQTAKENHAEAEPLHDSLLQFLRLLLAVTKLSREG